MKDWQGNIIKVGHTVIKVAVKQIFSDCKTEAGIQFENHYVKLGEFDNPREYLWEIISSSKIVDGVSMIFTKDRMNNVIPLDFIEFSLSPQPWEIICLEGISDNKEMYYMHEFNK